MSELVENYLTVLNVILLRYPYSPGSILTKEHRTFCISESEMTGAKGNCLNWEYGIGKSWNVPNTVSIKDTTLKNSTW